MDDERPRRRQRIDEDRDREYRPAWMTVLIWHVAALLGGFAWLRHFAERDTTGRGGIVFVYGISGIFIILLIAASVAALVDDPEQRQTRSTVIGTVVALAALGFLVVVIAGSLAATSR